MDKVITVIACIIMAVVLGAVFSALAGIPVYFLWNWLMPELFGLKAITFMQAIGLSVLCGCLFKGNATTQSNN